MRWRFVTLSLASVIIWTAAAAGWYQSYSGELRIAALHSGPFYENSGTLWVVDSSGPREWRFSTRDGFCYTAVPQLGEWRVLGIAVVHAGFVGSMDVWLTWIPVTHLAIISIVPLALWARTIRSYVRQRAVNRVGLCRTCGYDLRESPLRCPECGSARIEAATS